MENECFLLFVEHFDMHIWNVSLDIVCVYICLFAFFWHNHCPTFWYREGPLTLKLRGSKCQIIFTVRKNGQQKTYMQLLWQHCSTTTELNSATALEKKPCNLICCQTGSNVGGKTRNIAILVLQECCRIDQVTPRQTWSIRLEESVVFLQVRNFLSPIRTDLQLF